MRIPDWLALAVALIAGWRAPGLTGWPAIATAAVLAVLAFLYLLYWAVRLSDRKRDE